MKILRTRVYCELVLYSVQCTVRLYSQCTQFTNYMKQTLYIYKWKCYRQVAENSEK